MSFGARFGGGTYFGGGTSLTDTYYRVMRSTLLPGFWTDDDDAICNQLLKTDARNLGLAHARLDALERELFPHRASFSIADWEQLLGIVPPATATLSERRQAIIGAWRGAQPSTPAAIRSALAPLLQPEYAWRDSFPGIAPHWRYIQAPGLGTISVGPPNGLLLDSQNGIAADWPNNATTLALALHDPGAEVSIIAKCAHFSFDVGAVATGGIFIAGSDATRALALAVYGDATRRVRVDALSSSGITTGVEGLDAALGLNEWLRISISRDVANFYQSYNPFVSPGWQLIGSLGPSLYLDSAHRAGMFLRKTSNAVAASFNGSFFRVQYADQARNLNLQELTQVQADGTHSIFCISAIRYQDDAGTPQLRQAQALADRIKQAHTTLLVCETDNFLCDDLHSLCDRDPLGV